MVIGVEFGDFAASKDVSGLFHAGQHRGFAGEDGNFAEVERGVTDGFDDGVAHVANDNCEGWHGEEGPENEECFAGVGEGFVVAITDC